ncbi:aminotransferase class IV family protein [Pelistega ratti]|nr:aminotransferase class IV family protein [Pelistega ratti]
MMNTIFPLFETIAIEKGQVCNIEAHQYRYEQSVREYYSSSYSSINYLNLRQIIDASLPSSLHTEALLRCRLDYNHQSYQIQFFHYQRKVYHHFLPIICDDIDYHLKLTDRALLSTLLTQKGAADEIMIIKQGYVTDCSIGNLIFRKGSQWFTPNTPLLKGTMRQTLLNTNKLIEIPIRLEDLTEYEEIRLINALNPL